VHFLVDLFPTPSCLSSQHPEGAVKVEVAVDVGVADCSQLTLLQLILNATHQN